MRQKNVSNALIVRLNKFFEERNLNQYQFSQLTGVSYTTIKHIMQRRTKSVDLKTIILFAHGLGITPAEFINDDAFLYENLDI